jgi:hypothetical protein
LIPRRLYLKGVMFFARRAGCASFCASI